MRILSFIFIFAANVSLAEPLYRMSLNHDIKIPEEFSKGCSIPVTCTSPAQRYLDAFERSWWRCVMKKTLDINYQFQPTDFIWNGWPSAVVGGDDGCRAAESKINVMLKMRTKEQVSQFLKHELGKFGSLEDLAYDILGEEMYKLVDEPY